MSIENTRQCVRSKYFVSKIAMDESLSDFQETRHNCKGPKTTQKVIKIKTRKVKTRIKGQKDIRTALKDKKNELISYTKEFESVCKKSGIDVDSEQLQVAIALSKSLQSEDADNISTSKSLTTQGRIAKIKTTLKEYGFKVPETKITTKIKSKKHRKQYTLLNITEEERQQKIKNKYSQILFETLDYKLSAVSSYQSHTPIYTKATNLEYAFMKNNNVFYIGDLTKYIERSTSIGCLLKNWAEIPGRPASPLLFDKTTMDFSEIICSQDELDVILSGPIKSAHRIIATKTLDKAKDLRCNIPKVILDSEENREIREVRDKEVKGDHDVIVYIDEEIDLNVNKNTVLKSPATEIMNYENVINTISGRTTAVHEQYRSCSPDIFDDEVSCIMETSKVELSQGQKTKVFTEGNCMDLTECANNINLEKTEHLPLNTTKINLDDFMEITKCAVSASQGIKENEKEIDLMQRLDEKPLRENNCEVGDPLNDIAESPDYSLSQRHVEIDLEFDNVSEKDYEPRHTSSENDNNSINYKSPIECIDLVNNASTNNNILFTSGELRCMEPSDDIDLTQSSNESENSSTAIQAKEVSNEKIESMDLTQSSKSSVDISDLPEINLASTQKCEITLDETIILNEKEYLGADGKVIKVVVTQDEQIFDLTQAREEFTEPSDKLTKKQTSQLCSQSFYEDFIHNHSDSLENIDNIENYNNENSIHNTSKESNDIDLTQRSDKFEDINVSQRLGAIENIPNNSSLGKRDDVSIDYDEIYEQVDDKDSITDNNCLNSDKHNSNSFKSQSNNDVEIVDSNHDLISNSSQSSEVFDLTDKELDYSLHKSRLYNSIANCNYDDGGMSIMDDNIRDGGFQKSVNHTIISKNYTLEESFLPEVNIKNTKKAENTETRTADKDTNGSSKEVQLIGQNSKTVTILTPKNSEYIVKTDEVTPMLDYASLTTPQRNKELDKYGLKPFKRKRAIQILTHLYNQTHPVIEAYLGDEHPSPSKKRRQDSSPSKTSPKPLMNLEKEHTNTKSPKKQYATRNTKSPRKSSEIKNINSPRKDLNNIKESNAYEITSDVPIIKNVDCDPDDWVFQKREKAKIHSCRVPLHIAFHNYVSSRRSLREAILKYEPVNIDVIHKDLVSYGHRYDPKDLLRFLDKKCITVKTADNNARNKR